MKYSKLSIVVPTYDRERSLIRLLDSLYDQSRFIQQIIIIEQGIQHKGSYQDHIHKDTSFVYRYQDIPSTTKAKNIGASLVSEDIILFLDNDMVMAGDSILGHLSAHSKNIKVGGVCGRTFTIDQKINTNSHKAGKMNYIGEFTENYSTRISQEIDTVVGCNASWKRDVFNFVNGFDEQFTGNAMREESDLSLRVKSIGYKIMLEPNAIGYHLREPSGGGRKSNDRIFWYYHFFSNEIYYFLKHFSIVLLPIFIIKKQSWMLRCMFGFGREVSFRSIFTPLRGYMFGVRKYAQYKS